MNDQLQWSKRILDALRHIADAEYQRRAWLGVGPEVSSPVEVYNELFDDCRIEEFILDPPAYISGATRASLVRLERCMDELELDDSRPAEFIDHPAWQEVRGIATQAVGYLERDIERASN
jgi:hypothetical protein